MTDFLDHLSARAFETAAVIEPRRLSRFERDADSPVEPLLETRAETSAPVPRAVSPNDANRPDAQIYRAPRPAELEPPVSDERQPAPMSRSRLRAQSQPADDVSSQAAPVLPAPPMRMSYRPALTQTPDPAPMTMTMTAAPKTPVPQELSRPTQRPEASTQGEQTSPRFETRSETRLRVEREIHTREIQDGYLTRQAQAEDSRSPRLATPIPPQMRREIVRMESPSQPIAPAASVASAPAPTIHISIGRIEVRANRAASAPPPSAARAPRELGSDLAAYLRQRGGKHE